MLDSDSQTGDEHYSVELLKQINIRFDSLEDSQEEIKANLHIRSRIVTNLRNENIHLHQRVRTLEDRVLRMEKQMNNAENNQRKNNIEVDGIPESVRDGDLRSVVAKIFNHISQSDILTADIECAHRLFSKSSPKPTIVRLKRNLIDEIRTADAKTKLKDVPLKMGYPQGTKLYINDNQSPTMRTLSYNARLLKSEGLIAETWFSNAAVRIKRTQTSKPLKVTHEKDLVDNFPYFEGFTFDMDFYRRLREDVDMEKYENLSGNWSDDEYDDWNDDASTGAFKAVSTPENQLASRNDSPSLKSAASSSSPSSEEAARAKEDLVEHVKIITGTGVVDSVPLSKNPKKKSADITRRLTRKSKTQVSHDGTSTA
jgi:hypothetical protein